MTSLPEEKTTFRWVVGFVVAVGLHAAAAVGAMAFRGEAAPPPPPGAVMIDLAPEPMAPPQPEPQPEPIPQPPAPPAPPPEPEPEPEPEPQPEPEPPMPEPVKEPEAVIPEPKPEPPPPPKKVERKQEKPKQPPKPREIVPASAPSPPVAAPTQAPVAASSAPSDSVRTWQSTLLAHLERHKRYPRASQARREQGVAYVRFTMDRQGRVLSARLERASGHVALDEETVALVERAQPLPPPPQGESRSVIELVVPVRYALR